VKHRVEQQNPLPIMEVSVVQAAMAASGRKKHIRFSKHFGIAGRQADLDFVDVPIDTDVPLYVDPYSFKVNDDIWFIECNNLVVDFFQQVVDAISAGNIHRARELMYPLREPNGTHLGMSQGNPRGRGVGPVQANALIQRLSESRAVRTGRLHDLADCELMIRNISNDKISDITTNVVLMKLIQFTHAQCHKWNLPTAEFPIGPYWCPEQSFWRTGHERLPAYNDRPIILVPKLVIRRALCVDHHEYHRDFLIPHLQMEHLNANTSLVRVLKSGERRPPLKKDVEPELPCTKDAIFDYSEKHPELMKKYKDGLPEKRCRPDDQTIEDMVTEVCTGSHGITVHHYIDQRGATVMNNTNQVFGDSIGSAVGSGTVNARDIAVFKETLSNTMALDESTKTALVNARMAVESAGLSPGEKANIADDLGTLTTELTKPQKDNHRIDGILRRIGAVAPSVLTVLKSVKLVADLIVGTPPH
jgi:hypothetical protein